jgi:hypothetical protein
MPKREVVEVQVAELTKWGYKDATGFVSYSKTIAEGDKALVVPGASFTAEYYVSDSGTRYLNKIVASDPKVKVRKVVAKPVVLAVAKPVGKAEAKPESKGEMTRSDWDAKDRRISRQGCIQAAVQAVGNNRAAFDISIADLFNDAEMLANKMLEFVNEVKQ